ncbi:MAG: hypothetical protein BGO95_05965 [Micrococcales bacterium 73-13]|nr:MAG: hypothetical protein BGO95_05965 [Micrococcales bacterium 73-13]
MTEPDEPEDREPKRAAPPRRRRATTPPPAGSDPRPEPEPPRHAPTDNDERMRRDRPPHY